MKILIVDDNEIRLPKIINYLLDTMRVPRDDIDTETTGAGAREALKEKSYDLLLLDVLLKFRPESEPMLDTSINLMTELVETKALKKPAHIIGITAYEDAEAKARFVFQQQAWTILRSSDMSSDWLAPLGQSVKYILAQRNQGTTLEHGVDLIVISALRLEMQAFHKKWEWDGDEPLDDSTFIRKGRFQSGARECTVVSAVAPRMGMVSACHLASKLIERFRPRVVVMPGICAGLRKKADIGDVILADVAWDYQCGKHVLDADNLPDFQIDPHFIPIEQSVKSKWEAMAGDESLVLAVWNQWLPKYPQPPVIRYGPIASGSAVLADSAITENIRKQKRTLVGVEMEVYGVYFAAEMAAHPKPLVCAMKSVCDFADEEKDDGHQLYAAFTSASFVRAFFERYMVDLVR